MPGRRKRSLRLCNDRHTGSRKDVNLSHSPSISKCEHGRGRSRQLGGGEGRAATSGLFVWSEPPLSAHAPPNPCVAVLYGFRCCTGCFAQLLLHISSTLSFTLRICSTRGSSWREEKTLFRLLWNILPTESDGACLSCVTSWCLDADRYQKKIVALARATHFKGYFLTLSSSSCLPQICNVKLLPTCLNLLLRLLACKQAGAQKEWVRLLIILIVNKTLPKTKFILSQTNFAL